LEGDFRANPEIIFLAPLILMIKMILYQVLRKK